MDSKINIFQSILLPFITLIGGWIGNRELHRWKTKQEKNKADNTELNNISENFRIYQNLINDLETKFKSRISELEEDLEKVKVLNEELRRTISSYEKYIRKLKLKLAKYEELGEQDQ